MLTLEDLRESGELEGYHEGTPPDPEGFCQMDREIAETATCPECGSTGGEFRPHVKRLSSRWSYRGFAVCLKCGHAEEF